MTTKLEITFRAAPLAQNGTRDWKIESHILTATDESDPGATPDTKTAEHKLAEIISDQVFELIKKLEEFGAQ